MTPREAREQNSRGERRISHVGLSLSLPFKFSLRCPYVAVGLLPCFLGIGLTACKVGPNYHRPPAPVPNAYKEVPPPDSAQASEWVTAPPDDAAGARQVITGDLQRHRTQFSGTTSKSLESKYQTGGSAISRGKAQRPDRPLLPLPHCDDQPLDNEFAQLCFRSGQRQCLLTPFADLPADVSYARTRYPGACGDSIPPLRRLRRQVRPNWKAPGFLTRGSWRDNGFGYGVQMAAKSLLDTTVRVLSGLPKAHARPV